MTNGDQPINPTTVKSQKYKLINVTGLTKREYFAGLAMQGLLNHKHLNGSKLDYEIISRHAVCCADELLKQLEK